MASLVGRLMDFSTGEIPKVSPVVVDVGRCMGFVACECLLGTDLLSEVRGEWVDVVVGSWIVGEELLATTKEDTPR